MNRINEGTTTVALTSGCGFFGLLTIVLLVLKCLGVIGVSWFVVFLPVIIASGLPVIIFLIALICYLVIARSHT